MRWGIQTLLVAGLVVLIGQGVQGDEPDPDRPFLPSRSPEELEPVRPLFPPDPLEKSDPESKTPKPQAKAPTQWDYFTVTGLGLVVLVGLWIFLRLFQTVQNHPWRVDPLEGDSQVWVKARKPRLLKANPLLGSTRNEGLEGRSNRCLLPHPLRPPTVDPSWLTWNGGTVLHLAQSIYDNRTFTDLPILADALEEAGCTDPEILGHCRGGGNHDRECWVVDLVLGKT